MTTDKFLSLMEYSNKYDISISTLRRKIRAESIRFAMDNGKYFVPDIDIKGALKKERNQKVKAAKTTSKISSTKNKKNKQFNTAVTDMPKASIDTQSTASYSEVFQTANRMLDELKKAYSFILQEKEAQIISLNNEVSDLKTLVRVLEDELMKLRENS